MSLYIILAQLGTVSAFGRSGSSISFRPDPGDPEVVRYDLPKNRRFPFGLAGSSNPKSKKRKCIFLQKLNEKKYENFSTIA